MFKLGLVLYTVFVTGTIYHADPKQCNADYLTTASMKKMDPKDPSKHRYLAVSRDLERLGFTMGTKVRVTGAGDLDGIWFIEDEFQRAADQDGERTSLFLTPKTYLPGV